jgi:transposase
MGVIIGVDPHKASRTAAVLDERGEPVDQQRFASTRTGWRALGRWAKRWPERRWAVEGASGLGRRLAQQLVGEGEPVLDVPAKLAARVRLLSAGHGRKSDAHDAVSVAVAAHGPGGLARSASRTTPASCACSRSVAMTWCVSAPGP